MSRRYDHDGEMVAPAGKLSFEELVNIYKEQAAYILRKNRTFCH